MKKLLTLLLTLTITLASLTGCTTYSSKDVENLKTEIAELEEYKKSLEAEIEGIKEDNNIKTYVLTLSVKQNHYSLSISEHMKDEMNKLEFEIPVSKEFYDSVEEGDVIEDSFRVGSMLMKGSFGSWKIKVIDKDVR